MDNHFKSALFKLTAYYMLIVAVLCVGFSLIIFAISSAEFDRPLPGPPPDSRIARIERRELDAIGAQRADEARSRLAGSLIVVNAGALTLGGFGSYLLARRTLRPIQQAARAQGRFVSDASHELRTPLAVMQSEIEIALRGKPGRAELEVLARSNLEEVNRLRELSDRLLQLNSGGTLPLGPVVVEEAVIDAVTPHFAAAEARSIDIINRTDRSVARANADSLADLLSILIDNAIKYSPDGSRITLRSVTRGRSVMIDVADEGRGIDARDLPYVFDRFYRADLSRSNADVTGQGLGLSIAKAIADRMRGDLSVKSELAKGTIFTLRLDAARTPAKPAPAQT